METLITAISKLDAIIAAVVSGSLALVGVIVTVRNARRTSTSQHVEQTSHLVTIQERQIAMLETINEHRYANIQQFEELHDKVDTLGGSQEALLTMMVDVESKVTKPAKRKVGAVEPVGGF